VPASPAVSNTYGTVVIVGGGCYGSYYLRQLRRAAERGVLSYERIVIADRDANCAVAKSLGADAVIAVEEWNAFFARYLAEHHVARDAIVPSPLMPHVLAHWIESRARERWPSRHISTRMPTALTGVPWQREGEGNARYVSFAEWMCPVNCIEPDICPHTRSERSWSLPVALAAQSHDDAATLSAVFHCTHRAYGVGMIDVADVLAADLALATVGAKGPTRCLIGTVSHCHGALAELVIDH
jgi:hypothetical protein